MKKKNTASGQVTPTFKYKKKNQTDRRVGVLLKGKSRITKKSQKAEIPGV